MARVTVEDCLQNVDNRFQLVLVAAKRARQLTMGKEPLVDWENDKATVVALREISEGLVDRSILDKEPEPVKQEESLEDLLAAAESGQDGNTEQSAQAMSLAQQAESLFKSSDEKLEASTSVDTAVTGDAVVPESAPVEAVTPEAPVSQAAAPEASATETDGSADDVDASQAPSENPDQTL